MTYKQIKAKHNITDAMVANWFDYKTAESFRKSTKYDKVVLGIEQIYSRFSSDKEVKKEEVINNVVEQIKKL